MAASGSRLFELAATGRGTVARVSALAFGRPGRRLGGLATTVAICFWTGHALTRVRVRKHLEAPFDLVDETSTIQVSHPNRGAGLNKTAIVDV